MDGSFERFEQIIARLRGKNGCPWDREQTLDSLKPCMINEMTEVLAAVDVLHRTDHAENLCEELGDLLMNVVMMARIAEEEGLFTMDDVIGGISEKMIRRHPHVFGDAQADNSEQVLVNWEEIKKQEKREKSREEMDAEAAALPEAQKFVIRHLSDRLS